MNTWNDHVQKWKDCTACPLHELRHRIVLGRGTVPCDVVFIGQAPGSVEDATGLPFKGDAGRILDQIIDKAFAGLEVTHALFNLVCCYPGRDVDGDNEPTYAEIMTCRPRLQEAIRIADPKLVVTIGALATGHAFFPGREHLDIIHPASMLGKRMPQVKKQMAANKCVVQIRSATLRILERR